METTEVSSYKPEFKHAFKNLNLEWIEHYFKVEKKDLEQVNAPEECLAAGGEIFFVVKDGQPVGTCAMYKAGEGQYELAKMAIQREFRGQGLADLLMKAGEDWAKAKGATEIIILSNTILEPAIQLYKKHGYITVQTGKHPDYDRCNIEMRKKI